MSQYVTDTHPLLWHISNDPRLSAAARIVFTEADAGLHQIFVPSIVLVEAVYLVPCLISPLAV
jgi:PIN domain nuclease of toxin-antitoxin system